MQRFKRLFVCILILGLLSGCQSKTENDLSGQATLDNHPITESAKDLLFRTVKHDLEQHTSTSTYRFTADIDLNQSALIHNNTLKTSLDTLNDLVTTITLVKDRANAIFDADIAINAGGVKYNHQLFINHDNAVVIKLSNDKTYLTIPPQEGENNETIRYIVTNIKSSFYSALTEVLDPTQFKLSHNVTINTENDEERSLSVISLSLDSKDLFTIFRTMVKNYTADNAFMKMVRRNIKQQIKANGKKIAEDDLALKIDEATTYINASIDRLEKALEVKSYDIELGIDSKELLVYEKHTLHSVFNNSHTVNTINAKDKNENIEFTLYSTAEHHDFNLPYTPKKVILTEDNSQTLESLVSKIIFSE